MMHVMIAADGSEHDAEVAEVAHRLFGEDARYWAAGEHDADVIVVGSHERGWWSKLLSSSVTDDVLDASTIPALVVKGAADIEAPHTAS